MENAKQRRTFVALSFRLVNNKPESAYSLSYVYIKDDKREKEGTLEFKPIVGAVKQSEKCSNFETAFEKIRTLLSNRELPVIVWDDKGRKILDTLLKQNEILVEYPPRYFLLKKYACRKIWNHEVEKTLSEIAKALEINISPAKEPDAEHMAQLMRRIEDKFEFPSMVAKAFCAFCDSVMEDFKITLNEAQELRSFAQLISDRYPEFKKLENELDDVLEDGVVTEEESDRMMRFLGEMRDYYRKFIVEEKGEKASGSVTIKGK